MEELKIYRNELKNSRPPKYKVIGIVSEVILSTELFKYNVDTKDFLFEVFDQKFAEYVFGSRTVIISRIIRVIQKADDKQFIKYKNNLYKFLAKRIDESKEKEKNTFNGWVNV